MIPAMARKKTSPPPAADLRARILEASVELLDREGVAALSLREVARRAGVSHQAPYHYFEDRESILAAIVERGFDELTGELQRAIDGASGLRDRKAHWVRCGEAYVRFALSHPGAFRVMFRPELVDLARFPRAVEAGARAYAQLERIVAMAEGPGSPRARATLLWSVVHGLACLYADGPLRMEDTTPRARQAHTREVLHIFAEGIMGRRTPRASARARSPAR